MWPAALLLTIGEPQVLNVQERVPLMLVVSTPTGQVAETSKSELIRITSDLIKRHTDFFPQDLDELVVEDCKGRLTCLALKSRRSEAPDQPRYLLLVSNVSVAEQADRISLTLVDLATAVRIHRDAARRPGWQDEVEATISEQAVLGPPLRSEVRDAQEAATFLATAFTRDLAAKLEEAGHWEPYGDIEIACEVEGAAIKLDGESVGVTGADTTVLAGTTPGTRTIEIEHPGYLPFRTTVDVSRRQTAHVDAALGVVQTNGVGVVRQATIWGGVALGAAGIAIAIVGITKHGDAQTSCFAPCDTGSEFLSFGYDPSRVGSTQQVNPSGVAIVPLGLAFAGAGLTWSLGTWLLGREDDVPWIQLLVGLAVGGATYGLSVLADGSTPEAQ